MGQDQIQVSGNVVPGGSPPNSGSNTGTIVAWTLGAAGVAAAGVAAVHFLRDGKKNESEKNVNREETPSLESLPRERSGAPILGEQKPSRQNQGHLAAGQLGRNSANRNGSSQRALGNQSRAEIKNASVVDTDEIESESESEKENDKKRRKTGASNFVNGGKSPASPTYRPMMYGASPSTGKVPPIGSPEELVESEKLERIKQATTFEEEYQEFQGAGNDDKMAFIKSLFTKYPGRTGALTAYEHACVLMNGHFPNYVNEFFNAYEKQNSNVRFPGFFRRDEVEKFKNLTSEKDIKAFLRHHIHDVLEGYIEKNIVKEKYERLFRDHVIHVQPKLDDEMIALFGKYSITLNPKPGTRAKKESGVAPTVPVETMSESERLEEIKKISQNGRQGEKLSRLYDRFQGLSDEGKDDFLNWQSMSVYGRGKQNILAQYENAYLLMNGRLSDGIKALYDPFISRYKKDPSLLVPGYEKYDDAVKPSHRLPDYEDGELENFKELKTKDEKDAHLDKHFSFLMLDAAMDDTLIEKYLRFFRDHVNPEQHERMIARFNKYGLGLHQLPKSRQPIVRPASPEPPKPESKEGLHWLDAR